MSRDIRLYLDDILQSCRKILRYTEGMDFTQFQDDERTYDAVIRNLEIIGEASRNLPSEIKHRYPEIEWRSISAFRNIVAHEYFAIKSEIVWDIIRNKIPEIQQQFQYLLKEI